MSNIATQPNPLGLAAARTDSTSDGTIVTINEDGSVDFKQPEKKKDTAFSSNLAETIDPSRMSELTQDLLQGIEDDIQSRSEMVNAYVQGIDLLGLKMKQGSGALNKKNTASITHPILLESIVRFQSLSRAELLPSDGPVKVKIDVDTTEELETAAQELEQDFNHYLTTTATEYYPDTDRGLFRLGFGGTIFKKVYHCPLRNRPVSECVYLPDLIVSEDATDLRNAIRVTHQIMMNPSSVKKMQLNGQWLDVSLTTPIKGNDPVGDKVKSVEGISPSSNRLKDQQYTIYECYCELDLDEHPKGMPLPYRVTLEKDSRTILEIRRAWKKGDKEYKKKLPFVMYGLIPGMGFLCYGYLHLLGNQAKTLTAIWRLLIDAGMFNNFPGGVKIKGSRQTTNEINPGPGEWVEIDPGVATDIRSLLMPLPYKEPSPVFIQFAEQIANDVGKISSATMVDIGEGKSNTPVGTMMAIIEQQTQIMAAVHKRLHTSQAEEFRLLRELFAEDPESLWKNNPNPKRQWTADELTNLSISPASDPNIPAQTHRIMQSTALATMAQQNPQLFNTMEVAKRLLKNIGIGDGDLLLNQNPQQAPDPAHMNNLVQAQSKQAETQVKVQEQQREAAQGVLQAKLKQQELQQEGQLAASEIQSREKIAQIHLEEAKVKAAGAMHQANKDHLIDQHNVLLGHKKLEQENARENQGGATE